MQIRKLRNIFIYLVLSIIGLVIILITLIRLPVVQQKITRVVTERLSDQLGTTVQLKKLYFTYQGDIQLEKILLKDQNEDTLLSVGSINIDVSILPLLSRKVKLNNLSISALSSHIYTEDTISQTYNFQFLIDNFAAADTLSAETDSAVSSKQDSNPWTFKIGQIDLTNFDLAYEDSVHRVYAQLVFQNLSLSTDTVNFNSLHFGINSIKLKNAKLHYSQSKPFTATDQEQEKTTAYPYIQIDNFKFSNVSLTYENLFTKQYAESRTKQFLFDGLKVDLAKQQISLNDIELDQQLLLYDNEAIDTTTRQPEPKETAQNLPVELPKWKILTNTAAFTIDRITSNYLDSAFIINNNDSSNTELTNVQVNWTALNYSSDTSKLDGLQVKIEGLPAVQHINLKTALSLKPKRLIFEPSTLMTANSQINFSLNSSFSSFSSLVNNFERQITNLRIPLSSISIEELNNLYRLVSQNKSLFRTKVPNLKFSSDISLQSDRLSVKSLYALLGTESYLKLTGTAENITDSNLAVNELSIKSFLLKDDLNRLLKDSLARSIPYQLLLNLKASFVDSLISLRSEAITENNLIVKAKAKARLNQGKNYNATVDIDSILLTSFVTNAPVKKPFQIHFSTAGSGYDLSSLKNESKLIIDRLAYNGHSFDSIPIQFTADNSNYTLNLNYRDSLINTKLKASLKQIRDTSDYELSLAINKLKLKNLKLNDSIESLNSFLRIKGKYANEYIKSDLKIDSNFIEWNKKPVNLHPIELSFTETIDSTQLLLNYNSSFLRFRSSVPLTALQLNEFTIDNFRKSNLIDYDNKKYKPLIINSKLQLREDPVAQVFLADSLDFEPISLSYDYNPLDELSSLLLNVPKFSYGNIMIDSLRATYDQHFDSIDFGLTFNKINTPQIAINQTEIEAILNPEKSLFNVLIEDAKQDSLFNIAVRKETNGDSTAWSVNTDNLILKGKKWTVNDNNRLYINYPHLTAHQFDFKRKKQKFAVRTNQSPQDSSFLFTFNNFSASNLLSLVELNKYSADAELNGSLRFNSLADFIPKTANLDLNSIRFKNDTIGALQLSIKTKSDALKEIKLESQGKLNSTISALVGISDSIRLNQADLTIKRLDLPYFLSFADSLVTKTKGYLSADFNFKYQQDLPVATGNLTFNNTEIFVLPTNSLYRFSDTPIRIEQNNVLFNDYFLADQDNKRLMVNGQLDLKELVDPYFDLSFNSDDFQLLNTDKPMEVEEIYGKAILKSDFDLKGKINDLSINGLLQINNDSKLNYTLPGYEADMIKRDDVFYFKSKTTDSLDNEERKQPIKNPTSVTVNTRIKTEPKAQFKIIVDERRGDYLSLSGDSDLSISMQDNDNLKLNGIIKVEQGYYQLSLYDLVKRKFTIVPGSVIEWSGDPYNGTLSIRTQYNVKTSAYSLMQEQISGLDESSQARYRQPLNFIVYMNIDGNLEKPEITFELDMQENNRAALNGSVYNQIQRINRDESRLNKQVFALLVLNQFFPTGNSSSKPDAELIARSSASQLLSNQLNKLSEQYVKGINIDLDLDSFEDYQGENPGTKTQLELNLSKRLFNDRFRVEVGNTVDLEGRAARNQTAENIIGNILIEYMLTENERFKLTAYRKNQWEGLIDGQLIVTGISIKFNRDFQKISDLWSKEKADDKK